ncbi:hypothetical protein LSTR_LSTR011893 [Laodelphax striatellus]|uniref:EGF-like domain-containing protein n=1 Tax=Laodelphax striatellus TaxID=195883 RepID=A0A482XKT0_LAOST|nr:hypothetical protein LSTR_LSTR011893 [Laodelphax striatellus]
MFRLSLCLAAPLEQRDLSRGDKRVRPSVYCTGDSASCVRQTCIRETATLRHGFVSHKHPQGYCFNGVCPTLNVQCARIWGIGGKAGDQECFRAFNSKGSQRSLWTDGDKSYIKCDSHSNRLPRNKIILLENAKCGSLQCQNGNAQPILYNSDQVVNYATTIISMKGVEFECKTTSGTIKNSDLPPHGLVRDGTPCGENLICVNQSCVSIYPFMDQGHCPSNHNNHECSGHGVCSNLNKCHCDLGWTGPDCSLQVDLSLFTFPSTEATLSPQDTLDATRAKEDLEKQMKSKVTPYENYHSTNTVFLVGTLMSVVGGVFILFALMALCYRSVVVHKNFSLCLREHKMHKMQRLGLGSGSEEEPMHSGEEAESVSIIGLASNNLSKLPEKGILKKSCPYGDPYMKEKWSSEMDSQSDNLEILSQSDNNLGSDMMREGGAISEVERQLKSLNGYHEDLLQTLKRAASQHRVPSATSSACLGGGGPQSTSQEDLLRRSLAAAVESQCYKRASSQDKLCDGHPQQQTHTVMVEGSSSSLHHHHHRNHRSDAEDDEDDDVPPSLGPIRIRNLEDLIRQLEHHSRHMSPSGSEDIRMSETEADRNYRLDAQSGRLRGRASLDDHPHPHDARFTYGRYRGPPSGGGGSSAPHLLHLGGPSSASSSIASAAGHSSSHAQDVEEGIYESADPPSRAGSLHHQHHHRGGGGGGGDNTPDSESPQLERWRGSTSSYLGRRTP